jgi:NADH-quinone oxidoreductase subunit N
MMPLLAALTNVITVVAQATPGDPSTGFQLPGTPGDNVVGGRVTNSGATLVTPDVAWRALLPLIILGVAAVLLLTFSSVLRKKAPQGAYALFTVLSAVAAMIAAIPLWARVQGWEHILWWHLDTGTTGPFSTLGSSCRGTASATCGAVGIDGFSLGITFVICFAILLAALFASDYLRREDLDGPELYVLLLISGAGGVVMAMANDLIVLFLGLETLSIAVYVLAAMHRKRIQSQEAGLKYFVLGAFSSAFFLYGVAMVYGATATTNLVNIKNLFAANIPAPIVSSTEPFAGTTLNSPLLLLGLGLMLVGLGFKVAAVPFHFWSPDVYDGSPSPVVAFMASGVKAAGFAALVRVFVVGFASYSTDWRPIVGGLAALSMIVGAILAIVQTNVKRTLAYSSINHAGFILMAVQAASDDGNKSILFYVVTYTFMVAGSFGIVSLVSRRGDNRVSLDDYRGLGKTNPGLAFLFTIFLLAQAGVPFTSGFVAKLYTVIAAIAANTTWLAIIAMVSSVVATYLYLRIIVSMYMSADGDGEGADTPVPLASRIKVPLPARLALLLCFVVTVGAGLFPGPLTDFSKDGRPVLVNVAEPPTTTTTITPGAPAGAVPADGTGEPAAQPATAGR